MTNRKTCLNFVYSLSFYLQTSGIKLTNLSQKPTSV